MAEAGAVAYRVACLDFSGDKRASEAAVLAVAEACFCLSPQVAVRAGEAVFLEVGHSHHLFSEKTVELRLLVLARRFGLEGRVAIENSSALALASARWGSQWEKFPLSVLPIFYDPFRVLEDKMIGEMIEALDSLGVHSLGAFCALPSGGFASRFGRLGVELAAKVRAARVADLSAWPGFHPEESVTEEEETECENLEALLFVLRGVVDRAMARLRGRGERASVVEVEVRFENWSTLKEPKRSFRVELVMAQGGSSGLIPILKERLDYSFQKAALPAPVRKVSFKIIESVPGRGAQRDFFHKKEDEAEACESLIARLSDHLGASRVFMAKPMERYLPEQAYERVAEIPVLMCDASAGMRSSALVLALGERPTRLLARPEILNHRGGVLSSPAYQRGCSWKVLRWEGPERLTGDWWKSGFYRDYYRVFTESGEKLWVYADRSSQARHALYLHGFFD